MARSLPSATTATLGRHAAADRPIEDRAPVMTRTQRRVVSLVVVATLVIIGIASLAGLHAVVQIAVPVFLIVELGIAPLLVLAPMNALRFVLDGHGANTVVDGKPCPMFEGDLILTPGWTWHEHLHPGDGPIVWLDVLDASLHRYLGTDAFEPGPPHDVPARTADAAYAFAGVLPVMADPTRHSPVFRYPWDAAAAALAVAPHDRDGARRVRYVNPATGGATMSLLDCTLMEIDAGATTIAFRTSSHSVCAVVEGRGTTTSGDAEIAWAPKDVFALPSGAWVTHRCAERARIFVTTDREVLRRLDLLEENYAS